MYTADWFKPNIPNWQIWLDGFKDKPNLSFLEIGCFEGRATKWLCDNILTRTNSRITVIDHFKGGIEYTKEQMNDIEGNFKENLKEHIDKIKIYEGNSINALIALYPEKYDFIYVDASHYAPNVLEDSVLSWLLLKKDGVMVWDDYKFERHENILMRAKIAIDAILTIYAGQYELLHKGYQVAIKKI